MINVNVQTRREQSDTMQNINEKGYPEEWDVVYEPIGALPENYEFGFKEIRYPKGTVFSEVGSKKPLPCDVIFQRDVPVPLRDGAVIYIDLIFPADYKEAMPALINYSPYGKTLPLPAPGNVPPEWHSGLVKFEGAEPAFFCDHGYVIVNPDPRGIGMSGGNMCSLGRQEARDGYDLIEWVASQKWSNGRTALYGASWLAMTQWFQAALNPPHLSAIVPWNGLSDFYRHSLAPGGIPDSGFNQHIEASFYGKNQMEKTSKMVLENHGLMNEYWDDKSAKMEQITVPAYVVVDGIATLHTTGAAEGYRRLSSREKWMRLNANQEWYDQYNPESEEDVLKFLDYYLKQKANEWTQTSPVCIDVNVVGRTGEKVSREFQQWPVEGTVYKKLYLDVADASMSEDEPTQAAEVSYEAETGEVSFTCEVPEDFDYIGYGKAVLYVEAVGNDNMDLFVLVEKCDAEGNAQKPMPVCREDYIQKCMDVIEGICEVSPGAAGRLRVSRRELDQQLSTPFIPVHTFKKEEYLRPGEIVRVEIPLTPRAYRFYKGEKIRFTVGGHDIKVHGNLQTCNKGTHRIHTGTKTASYIQIPVVPIR